MTAGYIAGRVEKYSTGYPEADAWMERMYQQWDDEYETQLTARKRQVEWDRYKKINKPEPASAPYGYTVSAAGNIVEHPKESAVIAEMRQLRDDGYTLRDTARIINGMGHRKRKGKRFSDYDVAYLTKRQFINVEPTVANNKFGLNRDGTENTEELAMIRETKRLRQNKTKWKEIAEILTKQGYRTRRGTEINLSQVSSMYRRYKYLV